MHLYLEPLLKLFDDPPHEDGIGKCIGALNANMGEGLGLALLQNKIGNSFTFIDEPCKEDHNRGGRGKQLDAWAKAKLGGQDRLLQIEIKNWSAAALGTVNLSPNARQQSWETRDYRRKCWNDNFLDFNDYKAFMPWGDHINKVLRRMVLPSDFQEKQRKQVMPVLILWAAMHPEGKSEALFPVRLPNTRTCRNHVENFGDFREFWFFSMSSHIRNLHHKNISSIKVDEEILQAPKQAVEKLTSDLDIWLKKFFDGQ